VLLLLLLLLFHLRLPACLSYVNFEAVDSVSCFVGCLPLCCLLVLMLDLCFVGFLMFLLCIFVLRSYTLLPLDYSSLLLVVPSFLSLYCLFVSLFRLFLEFWTANFVTTVPMLSTILDMLVIIVFAELSGDSPDIGVPMVCVSVCAVGLLVWNGLVAVVCCCFLLVLLCWLFCIVVYVGVFVVV
jgi:hypothetical protein